MSTPSSELAFHILDWVLRGPCNPGSSSQLTNRHGACPPGDMRDPGISSCFLAGAGTAAVVVA